MANIKLYEKICSECVYFSNSKLLFCSNSECGLLLLKILYLLVLKKYFSTKVSQKRMKLITGIVMELEVMCFHLNYSEKRNYLETIPVAVKNFAHLFYIASQILECDKLH